MADTLSVLLGVVLTSLFTLLVLHYSLPWQRRVHRSARLPKGNFGWPIIGETLALSQDPIGFGISHVQRYGSIFKSSVFMRKTILGTTPEFAKFVCTNPDTFPLQYPKSLEFILPNSVPVGDGPRHVVIKKHFKRFLNLESLANRIPALESLILENLASWEDKGTVAASDATQELIADTSAYLVLGVKRIRSTPEGRLAVENMLTMISSIGGVPINLPGTAHHKGRQARNAVRSYLKSIVEQRKSQEGTESHMLGVLLEARDKEKGGEVHYLDGDKLIDETVGAWLAALQTTAVTMAWTMKFLVDYPDIFKRIQAEQQEILEGKNFSVEGPRLTWEDTRKMVYTGKFFQEIQRTLSLSFVITRKAVQDIVYDGFLIPKGWAVFPMSGFLHHDPAHYEDPMTFNPDRFDVAPKPNTYLPFGQEYIGAWGRNLPRWLLASSSIISPQVTNLREQGLIGARCTKTASRD